MGWLLDSGICNRQVVPPGRLGFTPLKTQLMGLPVMQKGYAGLGVQAVAHFVIGCWPMLLPCTIGICRDQGRTTIGTGINGGGKVTDDLRDHHDNYTASGHHTASSVYASSSRYLQTG